MYKRQLLDYLCEHFNGNSEQMYELLVQSEKEHVEFYDLPERLLAQMMFSGETEHMDPVYDCYRSGKQVSAMVSRAYFTMKSCDYFLKNRPTKDSVFAYLEDAVRGTEDKKRVPTIYLLALTLWYSRQEALTEEQKELASGMTEELLEEGFVREIISKIQTMRKEAGFEVTDHITVGYKDNAKIESIFSKYADEICADVLADKLTDSEISGYTKEWSINGEKVMLGVEKTMK